jgi:hypothetical protein
VRAVRENSRTNIDERWGVVARVIILTYRYMNCARIEVREVGMSQPLKDFMLRGPRRLQGQTLVGQYM